MSKDHDLYKAIASANYIRDKLIEGVSTNEEVIIYLKTEILFLLGLIQNWQDQICSDQKQVNWLKDYNITYNLSGYSSFDLNVFKLHKQLDFQQYLDNLPSTLYPRYKIIYFDLMEQSPGSGQYTPIAHLCPVATFIDPQRGGPNGSVNPPSPSPPR